MDSPTFSAAIRAQVGRGYHAVPEVEKPVGDIGIGRGGACLPMRPAEPSMSSLIRAQRRERRERIRELAVYLDSEGRGWVG